METNTNTERKFAVATMETLVGNLQAAIDFNASLELITELCREIALRNSEVLSSYFQFKGLVK